MKTRTMHILLVSMWIIIIVLVACATVDEPTTPSHEDHTTEEAVETEVAYATEEGTLEFALDPEDLKPCGHFKTMRELELAPPAAPAATLTPDPNAPTPRPAPDEDRVGFPENYETDFKLMFVFDRPDRKLMRAICGNDIAVRTKPGEEFEYGSVLLMISYAAKLDEDGQPVLDENGHYIGTRLTVLHVMRKDEGFGEAYGENQSGEWEYAGYKGDGSYDVSPQNSNFCSDCHLKEAGHEVDYVFRMNMFTGGEAEALPHQPGENEVRIYLYRFHESEIKIKAGTTITWINDDQAIHTIQSGELNDQGNIVASQDPLFASGVMPSATIKPGSSYQFTFDIPGTYLYLCTTHIFLTGKIVVTP